MNQDELTAHCGRLSKDLSHIRVHLDQEILLDCDLPVSNLDLSFDPLIKLISKNGGTDVSNPLPGSFWKFK